MSVSDIARLVLITHVDGADIRWVQTLAADVGVSLEHVRPYAGDPLPPPSADAAAIVLGGPMSVGDDLPFLAEEMAYLDSLASARRPVIGICLGAQLLTRVLGGDVEVMADGPETGMVDITAAPAAARHGLGSALDRSAFSFHREAMRPPVDADVLATSPRCVQAWSRGSALAIQFHPELSADGLREFAAIEADLIARIGLDMESLITSYEADEPAAREAWLLLARSWLAGSPSH